MFSTRYGIDSPRIVVAHYVIGGLSIAIGFWLLGSSDRTASTIGGWAVIAFGAITLAECTGIVLSGLAGKRLLWRRLMPRMCLSGRERVLDVGTGSGLQLAAVARELRNGGIAVGVDSWQRNDQSSNHPGRTMANMRAEGVADRVRLVRADMRAMPFATGEFDAAVTTLAVHNLSTAADREQALREIVRVLKPGGVLTLVDFWRTKSYPPVLHAAGCVEIHLSSLRFLPFPHVRVLTATRGSAT